MTAASYKQRGLAGRLFSRALHTYFLVFRGLTLGVRAIVLSQDGKFLLVRHTYTPGWHLPGGGVEKRETAVSALSKELRQETGLNLIGIPVLHGVFHNSDISVRDHILVYLCDVEDSGMINACSHEIAEIGFFQFNDLPDCTDPGTIRRMQELINGTAPSEAW